ncbi:MAG: FesM [Planctomycetia bacterium]|nr:FesM [Planctomycetia bacterium]
MLDRAPTPVRQSFDLLRVPVLGRVLRWRHARLTVQLPMLLLAGIIVYDGLTGPQTAPLNLAGVAPWIHWRGLVVLGLLFVGNVSCFACPFVLPRAVGRRHWSPRWNWPRRLRSKWLAVLLLLAFFWAYEVCALWSSPWWTAWLVLGYFVTAFAVDVCFRGAAFCKYVCPIGQFNYVQSLMSPLEVTMRVPQVCADCRTKDCIQASLPRADDANRGCALGLYLPHKAGNFDCTLCLECVHACPRDNIGLTPVVPGAELWRDRPRAGIGRFARRPDVAALVLLLVFAAFANAAGMVGPVLEVQDRLTAALRLNSPFWITTALLLLAVVVLPLLLAGAASAVSHAWSGDPGRRLDAACRFICAFAPLGFGMWLSHYCFHFFSSPEALVPAGQRFLADLGLHEGPTWICNCCVTVADWLLRLEILFLDLGLLLSLYAVYRIARERRPETAQALKAFAPWALILTLLFTVGVWIMFQPMEMRGMTELAR